jgi:hypothetical protein
VLSNVLLSLPAHAEAGKIFGEPRAGRRTLGAGGWALAGASARRRRRSTCAAAAPSASAALLPPCPADFNATLPVMMGEFLLLMVFLDKFWFGPVGATLDARDKELRGKLGLVKDNGSAVGTLHCTALHLCIAALCLLIAVSNLPVRERAAAG